MQVLNHIGKVAATEPIIYHYGLISVLNCQASDNWGFAGQFSRRQRAPSWPANCGCLSLVLRVRPVGLIFNYGKLGIDCCWSMNDAGWCDASQLPDCRNLFDRLHVIFTTHIAHDDDDDECIWGARARGRCMPWQWGYHKRRGFVYCSDQSIAAVLTTVDKWFCASSDRKWGKLARKYLQTWKIDCSWKFANELFAQDGTCIYWLAIGSGLSEMWLLGKQVGLIRITPLFILHPPVRLDLSGYHVHRRLGRRLNMGYIGSRVPRPEMTSSLQELIYGWIYLVSAISFKG